MSKDSHRTRLLRDAYKHATNKANDAGVLMRCLGDSLSQSILLDNGLVPGRTIAINYKGEKFVVDQAYESNHTGAIDGFVYWGCKIRKDGTKGVRYKLLVGVKPTQEIYMPTVEDDS